MKLDGHEIERAVGGELIAHGSLAPARRVVIDNRCVEPGDLFIAIVGERHDGHRFAADAVERGAVGVICNRDAELGISWEGGFEIRVRDTELALVQLADHVRRRFAGRVAAVTGSNGKTTTKNLLTVCLGGAEGQAVGSPASFNNHIGVPLSLLAVEDATRFAVLEIGTSGPGEIGPLAELARPDVAIITSIGESHLAGLLDLDGVVDEKGALLEALDDSGVAILHRDCAAFDRLARRAGGAEVLTFGHHVDADYRIAGVVADDDGLRVELIGPEGRRWSLRSGLFGGHNALNMVSAFAAAHAFGIEPETIVQRLAGSRPAPMRMERHRFGKMCVINDAYNANPTSTRAAIDGVGAVDAGPAPRVLVLGDMLELGKHSHRYHREILEHALAASFERVIAVGRCFEAAALELRELRAARDRLVAFEDVESALGCLDAFVGPEHHVLLKGSRGMALERCLPRLEFIGNREMEAVS